jgi:hypothetical protein
LIDDDDDDDDAGLVKAQSSIGNRLVASAAFVGAFAGWSIGWLVVCAITCHSPLPMDPT